VEVIIDRHLRELSRSARERFVGGGADLGDRLFAPRRGRRDLFVDDPFARRLIADAIEASMYGRALEPLSDVAHRSEIAALVEECDEDFLDDVARVRIILEELSGSP